MGKVARGILRIAPLLLLFAVMFGAPLESTNAGDSSISLVTGAHGGNSNPVEPLGPSESYLGFQTTHLKESTIPIQSSVSEDSSGMLSAKPDTDVTANHGYSRTDSSAPSTADAVHKLLGADDATPTGTIGANIFVVDAWQPTADGFVTQIRVKATANGYIKVAMYYDQTAGDINYIKNLMNAVNTGVPISAGWNIIPFPTTYVAAGRTYWIAYITDTNCVGYVSSGNNGYSWGGGPSYSDYMFEGVILIGSGRTPYGHSLIAGWGTGTGGSIDLAVEDIWTVPDPPLTNFPTVLLFCRVRNLGDNSPPLRIDGYYGGVLFLGPEINVLNGVTGSSGTYFVNFLATEPAGPYSVTVSVEPADTTMPEPNKANNVMTKVITWQEPLPGAAAAQEQSSGTTQSSVKGEQLYRIQSLSGADSPLQVLSISAASGNQDAQIANSAVKTGSTTEVGPAHHIVFTEDFEGDFPGPGWQLYGNPTWGKTTYKPECIPHPDIDLGNYVGWCAAGGSLARNPKDYAPDMCSWMVLGPFDFSVGGQLDYEYFLSSWAYQYSDNRFYGDGLRQLHSHLPQGCDAGHMTNWYGGVWKEWRHASIELHGSMPWMGIGFTSTSPGHSGWEGLFVDNIVISVPGTGPPYVNNSTGATDVTDTSARLNGNLVCDGGLDTTVTVYWGDNDGGTTEDDWDHSISLGTRTEGPFYTDISDLTEGTTYYYRCFASNSMGFCWASNPMSFTPTCLQPVPPVPVLRTPASGTTVSSLTPRLEWNAPTGAEDYGVQVSTSSSFTTQLVNEAGITNIYYDIPAGKLNWNTMYYWRVNAHNCGGTSAWSAMRYFRTAIGPPPSPLPTWMQPQYPQPA